MTPPLTCSAALFSAVRGRLEDRGLSAAPDLEDGRLEGAGESDRSLSDWLAAATDAAAVAAVAAVHTNTRRENTLSQDRAEIF